MSSPPKTLHDPEWVHFNVGGEYFCTTRSTILQEETSLLAAVVAGVHDDTVPVSRDDKGCILFDRDPKYFRAILNYLRSGEVSLDGGLTARSLLREAEYFSVQSLVSILQAADLGDASSSGVSSAAAPDDEREPDVARPEVIRALIASPSGTPLRFQGVCLNGVDLSELDLSGVNFHRAKLSGADLHHVSLRGANLSHATLTSAIVCSADLTGASLHRADASGSNFTDCILKNADLSYCNLTNAVMANVDLSNANLSYAHLRNVDLRGSNLHGAILKGAIFQGVNRTGTNLSMGGVVGTS